MDWMQSFTIDQLQWGYIVVVILLAALIVFIGWRRRDVDANAVAQLIDWFEIRGIGTVYQLVVLVGTFCLAWIGWRLPAEIENFYQGIAPHLEAFPRAETITGRLAQCVGAAGFTLIALRSMRYIVPIVSGMLVVLILLLSYHYIGYRF